MHRQILFLVFLFQFATPGLVYAQNVITVAPSGGDFTSPVDALDAIGTTLPASSAGNRYLVRVEPGVYTVNQSVEMKPFVDLQGSGVKTTIIRGQIPFDNGGPVFGDQGVINAASRSEIRQLTVRNTIASISSDCVLINHCRDARPTPNSTISIIYNGIVAHRATRIATQINAITTIAANLIFRDGWL